MLILYTTAATKHFRSLSRDMKLKNCDRRQAHDLRRSLTILIFSTTLILVGGLAELTILRLSLFLVRFVEADTGPSDSRVRYQESPQSVPLLRVPPPRLTYRHRSSSRYLHDSHLDQVLFSPPFDKSQSNKRRLYGSNFISRNGPNARGGSFWKP